MVSPSGMPSGSRVRAGSGAQRQLARAGGEAELDQEVLVRRADHRLAVDALEREPARAVAGDELYEGGEGRAQARVARLDERGDALAAALDVEHWLVGGQHDVGAPRALGPALVAVLLALRPGQRRAVGLRRVGGGEHERRALVVGPLAAQALDRAGQRELRPAEALDEVAAPAGADGLELRERVVQAGEAAGDALGQHLLARDDAVALEQQLGQRAPPARRLGRRAEQRLGQRPAALDLRLGAAATPGAEAAGRGPPRAAAPPPPAPP